MSWFFWALGAAVFAGATAILAKLSVENVNSHVATAVRTSVVLVFAWGVAWASGKVGEVGGWSRRTWVFLALSGVATGLSWLCYFRALQLGQASKVAAVDKLGVVFVVIFAALFLGEAVTWRSVVGAGMLVGGAWVLAGR